MPRGLNSSEKAQLAARIKAVVYFVELQLAAGTSRFWTGTGSITALSQTWLGVGDLGRLEGLESSRALEAQSISLALNGVPTSVIPRGVIDAIRGERYQGRPLKIYIGFLNTDTGALLFDPRSIWAGKADVASFQLGETFSTTLTGDHLTSHLRRINGYRMTTESHNQRLGNPASRDLFFEQQSRLLGRPVALVNA
jgi:hypothetical protein